MRISNAMKWALALTAERDAAYVLTSPVFTWPTMVADRDALCPLTGDILPGVRSCLEAIAADRVTHADPFDGFPA